MRESERKRGEGDVGDRGEGCRRRVGEGGREKADLITCSDQEE